MTKDRLILIVLAMFISGAVASTPFVPPVLNGLAILVMVGLVVTGFVLSHRERAGDDIITLALRALAWVCGGGLGLLVGYISGLFFGG